MSVLPDVSADGGANRIPEQIKLPWSIAMQVAWESLRRRFGRAMITMAGVILAIAFLSYMLVTDAMTRALINLDNDKLNLLLREHGVDPYADAGAAGDRMMLMLIGLSLLTCLVGIINSMLMAVTERVKEIGTLKCIGARDYFILKTYFIESSLQGVIGALMGLIGGAVVAISIALFYFHAYISAEMFPFSGVLKSLVISFLVGSLLSVIASIAPAYWAAKKQPVEAMRVEE